ncbi:MAG: hypothetical protein R2753_13070 [Chitinophagales bacterium]
MLEIASNDGSLIKHFRKHTNKLIGIEPSLNHIQHTESLRIKTYAEFFTVDFATRLCTELQQKPKLIMANNVLAHVPKL